jgi:hypothetical protein
MILEQDVAVAPVAGLRANGASETPSMVLRGRAFARSRIVGERSMLPSATVRTPDHMYAEHPGGERELYAMRPNPDDLPADPYQLTSRHVGGPFQLPGSAPLQVSLEQRLRELEGCAGAEYR